MAAGVQEVRLLLTIRVEAADGMQVSVDVAPDAKPQTTSEPLDDVLEGVARRVRPYVEEFTRRVHALGMRVQRPDGERQDYRNVVAPAAWIRSRLGAISVVSGRLAVDKVPELAAEEPLAEVFKNNGEPVGTKIYLDSPEAVEAAVRLCQRAVEVRDDARRRADNSR